MIQIPDQEVLLVSIMLLLGSCSVLLVCPCILFHIQLQQRHFDADKYDDSGEATWSQQFDEHFKGCTPPFHVYATLSYSHVHVESVVTR